MVLGKLPAGTVCMPEPGLWKWQRDTHHYSSHSGMFTQGCGPTGKTFQHWQFSFFRAEAQQKPCDITLAESGLISTKIWPRCRVSPRLFQASRARILKVWWDHKKTEGKEPFKSKSMGKKAIGWEEKQSILFYYFLFKPQPTTLAYYPAKWVRCDVVNVILEIYGLPENKADSHMGLQRVNYTMKEVCKHRTRLWPVFVALH